MNFEDILDRVGNFGSFQRRLLCFLYAPAIFAGAQALSYVFVSATPSHRCYVEACDNDTTAYVEDFLAWSTPYDLNPIASYSRCKLYGSTTMNGSFIDNNASLSSCAATSYSMDSNITEECHQWKFDQSIYVNTVVMQWDLVCDRSKLAALSQSVYMLGIMAGSIVFGSISDRYGRKTAMMIGLIISAFAATACSFVPNYMAFLALRFIVGASGQGFYQSIFIMSMEIVGKSKRALCGLVVSIYFSLGEVLLGILAFYVRDWKDLQLFISAPLFIFASYIWIIPESPRWMIHKGKYLGAKRILEKIAVRNNHPFPCDILNIEEADFLTDEADESLLSHSKSFEEKQHNIFSLFRVREIRWRTINILFNWFMNTVAYYGITMSTPSLGGSVYWNFLIVSAVEIPAYTFTILMIDRIGRRMPLCVCMVVGGIACTAMYFVPSESSYYWLHIGLALIGKFGASAAFGIIYVFTAELFPTVLRNNGIGLSSMVGHIGGVIAPYIANLGVYHPALPLTIYGSFSIVAGLTTLKLPETFNQELADTMEEAKDLGRRAHGKTVVVEGQSERFHLLSDAQDGIDGLDNST